MKRILMVLVLVSFFCFFRNNQIVLAALTECSSGEQHCDSIDVRHYCNSSYKWVSQTCPNICKSGKCVCSNGTTKCVLNVIYNCVSGSWTQGTDCGAIGCTSGSCNAKPSCSNVYGGVCELNIATCTQIEDAAVESETDCGINSVCCYRSVDWKYLCGSHADCVRDYGRCYYCNIVSTNIGDRSTCDLETASTDSVDGVDEIYNGSNGACQTYPSGVCSDANIGTKCTSTGGSSGITLDGSTYKWTCSGKNGGVCGGSNGNTANCTANKTAQQAGAAGVCNATATSTSYCAYANIPTKCDVGSATLISDDISGGIKWTCSGTTTGQVCDGGAGAIVNCGTTKIAPVARVDGVCSGINGTVVQAKPSSGLCNPGIPSPVPVTTTGITYSWTCNGSGGICPTNTAINRPCSAIQDTPPVPTITPIPVPPGITDPVPNPSGGIRLQNCQFSASNSITFSFAVSDANGIGDIAGVYFRFKGLVTEYGPVMPNAFGVVTFSNINISSLTDGTYTIQAKANDVHYADIGSAWVDLAFQFKKWDCKVEVDGEFYDSSEEPNLICGVGDNGFTTLIEAGLSFPFGYGNSVNENIINMTLASPYFTARKTTNNTLTWQNSYFLSNETTSNYQGVLKASKIGGTCVSPSVQFSLSNYVNAYDASPKVNIKYSAVMDQEAWFRVKDGSVLADVKVKNYVPVTCVDNCKTTLQGLVWSKKVDLSDSDESLTSEAQPQPPFKEYYEMLKYDIYGGLNIGTTFTGSVKWSDIIATKGVIFVGGDLTIDQDMVPTANDYVFFIVKGRIIIANTVTQVNGMFYTDTTIEVMGENDTQLKIFGSLYGRSGVNLSRSYVTKRKNNTVPAVEVTFDPNLIFRLPKKLWELYENWTLE